MRKHAIRIAAVAFIVVASWSLPAAGQDWPSCDHCMRYCQSFSLDVAGCLCENCPECAISFC